MQTTSRTAATASTSARNLKITCRYCKGAHFSARCPNKPVDLPLELPPSEDDLTPPACPTVSQAASSKPTEVLQNTNELSNTVTIENPSVSIKTFGKSESQAKPYRPRKFVISCRYCKGPHFSAKCPNKPSDLTLEVPPIEAGLPPTVPTVKSTKSLKSRLRDKSKHSVKNFKHKARIGGGKAGSESCVTVFVCSDVCVQARACLHICLRAYMKPTLSSIASLYPFRFFARHSFLYL